MLIEQNIEFESRGWAPQAVHVLLWLVYFTKKQKFLRNPSSSELLFSA